jgi:flagellar export protein FliJ
MSSADRPGDRLHAVERLQQIELDQARVERTRLQKAVAEQRRRMTDLQARLDASRTLEVTLITSSAGVSADALRQSRLYLRAQALELLQQQEVLAKAESAADNARMSVVGSFERLSATRRLRERRAAEICAQQLRARFREFDDMAIVTKRNVE